MDAESEDVTADIDERSIIPQEVVVDGGRIERPV